MSEALEATIVTAASTSLVAIVALLVNNKRLDDIVRRLDVIQADLKEFYKQLGDHSVDIQRLKDKTELK